MIDDQHAAIAAHCLSGSDAASLGVHLNDNSTKSVSSIWIDERYDEKTGAYDFAVLTLTSPVDSQFKPICLRDSPQTPMPASHLISPKAGKNIVDYPYDYLYNLYGKLIAISVASILTIVVEFFNLGSKCPSPATETHLCIVNPSKVDECPEGLYMRRETNNRFYLAGVTSRCFSSGMPDLYTDVIHYNKKIRELAPKGCWRDAWDFSTEQVENIKFYQDQFLNNH